MKEALDVSGWVYAALCAWANKNGHVQVIKSGDTMTLRRDGERIADVVVSR